jgi:hypothetical protein
VLNSLRKLSKLREHDPSRGELIAILEGVGDGVGLLVDLLEHEVLVALLLRRDHVPGDVGWGTRDRVSVEVEDRHRVSA